MKKFSVEKGFKVEYLGSGEQGITCRISEKCTAKFPWGYKSSLKWLEKEYEITEQMHRKGFSVVKPEGIFRIKTNLSLRKILTEGISPYLGFPLKPIAYVKEYVDGIPNNQIQDEEERMLASELAHKERIKAKKKGFLCSDFTNHGNWLYCPDKKQIVLVDLGTWFREFN